MTAYTVCNVTGMNRTSSTAQTFMGEWSYTPHKRGIRKRLVCWYMGRIAGRYCPCEWPFESRRLVRLCGRIDDAYVEICRR